MRAERKKNARRKRAESEQKERRKREEKKIARRKRAGTEKKARRKRCERDTHTGRDIRDVLCILRCGRWKRL